MKIRKMTATFGALQRQTLTLGEGMNVLTAPNESGKSTWAGFVKAMLYGVDTRERDKAGHLADKTRYQPWSGAAMQGEMEVEWQGQVITLRRSSNRSGAFQQFEAVYTASGDPVPGLTAANAGEKLLGVGKEVFTRSALVGQNASAIASVPELEARIAALATTAEEDVSYSEVERTLKNWHNRRRANRANGLIPDLERELEAVNAALSEMNAARHSRNEAEQSIAAVSERLSELLEERLLHKKLAAKRLNTRYGEALAAAELAGEALAQLPPPDPAFAGMTVQQALALSAERRVRQQEEQDRRTKQAAEAQQKKEQLRLGALGALAGGAALILFGVMLPLYALCAAGAAAMVLGVFLCFRSKAVPLIPCEVTQPEPIPDAEGYAAYLSRKEELERELRHHRERAEDLAAQGAKPYNTLELLPEPRYSAEDTERRIAAAEAERSRWQTRLDQAIGALRSDPLELEAKQAELQEKLRERERELRAIDEAMNTLERANTTLRQRFSPALNARAAAWFSALTGGKYSALTLSRDLSAMVEGEGGSHSALFLSAGTADQLYLAVRLALCELTVPESPILLDDALCAFDDERAERALEALRTLAGQRQILLFSCHGREGRWAAEHGVEHQTL